MKRAFIKILANIFSVNICTKFRNLRLLVSLQAYRNYFAKYSEACGDNLRLNEPLSIKGIKYMTIGDNFKLGFNGYLEAWDCHNGESFTPSICIGNNVSFGNFCHIGCINKVIIEDNVLTGAHVLVTDHSHGRTSSEELEVPPNNRVLYSSGIVHIKRNVWIGDKVTILPNVTIGENSIIGANSVVTHDIPANVVACGCPAKVVKEVR